VHEVGIAQRIVEVLTETVTRHGATRCLGARLFVGELTAVEPETLRFAFEVVSRDTPAEGCRLEIVSVPLRLRCQHCAAEKGGPLFEPCTACGTLGFEVLEGRELRLDTVDVDTPGE
jgi:hydrogenase nickel incorporation protein HypA/HybF